MSCRIKESDTHIEGFPWAEWRGLKSPSGLGLRLKGTPMAFCPTCALIFWKQNAAFAVEATETAPRSHCDSTFPMCDVQASAIKGEKYEQQRDRPVGNRMPQGL
jgi:hypothetical protein